MTPRQILLVKDSFHAAAPRRDRLTRLFLAELFARDPSLRPLFGSELSAQSGQLLEGLAAIVDSLDRLYPILPVLEWLAVRGARRGVGERQYAAVGEAMLAALETELGEAFTPELHEAWRAAYRLVARTMARAAATEPLAA